MKRRDFILATVGATILKSKAQAQQTSSVVGVLVNASQRAVFSNLTLLSVKARLAEMGYVEGRNLILEIRAADDQLDRLPSLAADLVQRRVAVIAAFSGPAVSAAKAATTSIPIVFFTGFDPVTSFAAVHESVVGTKRRNRRSRPPPQNGHCAQSKSA
jgi:putative ABC transport system substrate-binding protein